MDDLIEFIIVAVPFAAVIGTPIYLFRRKINGLQRDLAEQKGQNHTAQIATEKSALEERVRADRVLTEARTLLDGIDAELRNYEQTRHQRDEQALAQRERISQRKLDQQALVLSADTLQGAVEKAGFVLQDVLNALPEDARLGDWEQAVHQIDGRMRRLEPVNLAAIHEYGEAPLFNRTLSEERKSFLKKFIEAQIVSYEIADIGMAHGWFYWNFKMEGGAYLEWDFCKYSLLLRNTGEKVLN